MSKGKIGLTDKEIWRYEDFVSLLIPLIDPAVKQKIKIDELNNLRDSIRGVLIDYENDIRRLKKKDIPILAKTINIIGDIF